MSCSTSRQATNSKIQVSSFRSQESRDTVREQVVVAVHDTLREVTTITVQLGQTGDTVRVAQVTERDRLRDRSAVRDKEEKLVVRVDTVYVAVRDSVSSFKIQGSGQKRASPFVSSLKWIFWILVAGIVLIIVVKLFGRRSLL